MAETAMVAPAVMMAASTAPAVMVVTAEARSETVTRAEAVAMAVSVAVLNIHDVAGALMQAGVEAERRGHRGRPEGDPPERQGGGGRRRRAVLVNIGVLLCLSAALPRPAVPRCDAFKLTLT